MQQLVHEGVHAIKKYDPTVDKVTRMNSVTTTIENGFVHIPETAPWLGEFLHELTTFPKAKYYDQVDSMSQALHWFERNPLRVTRLRRLLPDMPPRLEGQEAFPLRIRCLLIEAHCFASGIGFG